MGLKKRLSKSIAIALLGIMVSTPVFNSVSAMDLEDEYTSIEQNIEDEELEIYPDLVLNDEEIKEIRNYLEAVKNEEIKVREKRALPVILLGWAGEFLIPGIGTVIVTEAGKIIVAGVTVVAGSYVGKKVKDHIYNSKKQKAEKAAREIPSRLKKKNGNVDLDRFTEKVKGLKSTWKDPKTGWVKQKDGTGHRGYDTSVKEWKIKRNPYDKDRVASVNSSGKVIDK